MKRAIIALVVVGTSLLPATASAGVDPASYSATLASGASTTITKTVQTPAIPANPDIVFLSDTTGSMEDAIANVQANATGVMGTVAAAQPTAEFAAASYKDEPSFFCPSDVPFQLDQALTSSISDTQAAIGTWNAEGGCDYPESQIDALYQLATDPSVGFRTGSTRIVVWFGDASGHDPSLGHTLTDAIDALVAANIHVIAIPVGFGGLDEDGQATAVANATSGEVIPAASPEQVSDAILTGLQNLPVEVTPTPTCDPGLTATYDATSKTVTSGTDATFDETLTVAPNASGVLKCTVDFLLNGNHVDGFQQSVTVTAYGTSSGGTFTIGGHNAADGTPVTFWGAQWAKLNSVSSGPAPSSFKGFETTPATVRCGDNWTTRPGNSGTPPPAGSLPPYMLVVVSSQINKSGPAIAGNTVHEVVVKTNPGYAPDPGHPGTGTVVAQIC